MENVNERVRTIDYQYNKEGDLLSELVKSKLYDITETHYHYTTIGKPKFAVIKTTKNSTLEKIEVINYEYDKNKNIIKEILMEAYPSFKIVEDISYEYDESNKITKEIFNVGTLMEWIKYERNEKGDISLVTTKYRSNELKLNKSIYEYNNNGSISKIITGRCDQEHNFETKVETTYVYDENNRLIQRIDNDEGEDYSIRYYYDHKNNLIREVNYAADRLADYYYNEANQLVQKVFRDYIR